MNDEENKINLQYLQEMHHHILLQLVLFILIPRKDSGLDCILFDDGQNYMTKYDCFNVNNIIL